VFAKNVRTINEHLGNVFREGELDPDSVIRNFRITASDGKNYDTAHYNLDAVISVGYRVNSKQGTRFRQWATCVLREHLIQGYTLNRKRLEVRGLAEAEASLALLARTLENQSLVTEAGRDVLALIVGYARTWRLLLRYDEQALDQPASCRPARSAIHHADALAAIEKLKSELIARGEATELFGQQRGDLLAGLLGSIEQTMFGEPLYKSREEKAAHILYFVIKDHPFVDGNKRIGSFLFLLYLEQEGLGARMNANALTALALLVAESMPANKELMIRLVMHLLAGDAA
jgi:prophage maintenance system killer protein